MYSFLNGLSHSWLLSWCQNYVAHYTSTSDENLGEVQNRWNLNFCRSLEFKAAQTSAALLSQEHLKINGSLCAWWYSGGWFYAGARCWATGQKSDCSDVNHLADKVHSSCKDFVCEAFIGFSNSYRGRARERQQTPYGNGAPGALGSQLQRSWLAAGHCLPQGPARLCSHWQASANSEVTRALAEPRTALPALPCATSLQNAEHGTGSRTKHATGWSAWLFIHFS